MKIKTQSCRAAGLVSLSDGIQALKHVIQMNANVWTLACYRRHSDFLSPQQTRRRVYLFSLLLPFISSVNAHPAGAIDLCGVPQPRETRPISSPGGQSDARRLLSGGLMCH